jgi:signal transduction histidine kinase
MTPPHGIVKSTLQRPRHHPRLRRFAMLLCAVVASQVALAIASMDALSGVRAYVMGEALYSRAQKDALVHVSDYAQAGDEAAYQAFLAKLQVNLGDRRAREALIRVPPDTEAAREGFLAGGNHPDDVPVLIRLFRWGRHFPFMAEPIRDWTEADETIAELMATAEAARSGVLASDKGDPSLSRLRQQIPALNHRLTQLEEQFSSRLNTAARETQRLLLAANIAFAVLVLALGMQVASRAVRAQARAEREREVRIGDLVDAVSEAVITFDQSGRIVLFNRAAERMFGTMAGQSIGKDIGTFVPALGPSACPPECHGVQVIAVAGVRSDRTGLSLEASLSSLETEAGRLTTVVARDAASLEAARRDREARQALEASAKAKNEFLSRVSHELRTPLNAVLGFAQLLKLNAASRLSREERVQLEQIEGAGTHLLSLVDDVLDLAGLEAGRLRLRLEPVPVGRVLDESLAQVSPMAIELGTRLSAPTCSTIGEPLVLADPLRLRQVLVNVLSNALKYGSHGGLTTISLRQVDGRCHITIRDTGAGLSEAQRSRLFEPFNRLGAERSGVEGIGVGLVISRDLMLAMNGTLDLESDTGTGTTVTLGLPMATGEARTACLPQALTSGNVLSP